MPKDPSAIPSPGEEAFAAAGYVYMFASWPSTSMDQAGRGNLLLGPNGILPADGASMGAMYSNIRLPFWRKGEHMRRNSPLSYVDRVQTPLLILHGDLDVVPITEPEMFFKALVAQRKPAQFVRYWGEGHGNRTPANFRDYFQRIFAWYDRWGDIARDATGDLVFDGDRVQSRQGAPPLPAEAYAQLARGPETSCWPAATWPCSGRQGIPRSKTRGHMTTPTAAASAARALGWSATGCSVFTSTTNSSEPAIMRILLLTLCAAGALGLGGCNDLTEVDAPDVVQPEDFTTAAGATALALGAITRFQLAFGGFGSGNLVENSGLMADELLATGTNPNDEGRWDARNPLAQSDAPYNTLHDARQRFLSAIGSFQEVAPDSSARIGQLFALLGYTSVFFGETYCAGVPLSHRDADLRPVYGQPLTTAQVFDSALTAFDSALVSGADSARIANLARVGRGRALLNLGRFSDAAVAVADVPTDYVYHVTYPGIESFEGGVNAFFVGGDFATHITIPEQEGTNSLNWRTAADPRVPLINRSPPLVEGPEVWSFVPYQSETAPIRLAGGIEARLIEAEAALQAGDATTWLALLNALRATVPGLDPLADPGSVDGRVDLHFRERGFWLFLTAHRVGDLRRLVRQYGRNPESVFPVGEWRGGVQYGTAVNMVPPEEEKNNPHYTGCLNRDA